MAKTYIRWLAVLIPLSGVVLAVLYSLTAWSSTILDASNNTAPNPDAWKYVVHALGTFLLISGAAFLSGALLGFLFGFPRTSEKSENSSTVRLKYQHNKNIEQISDWVIKMLIGIGLSQMTNVPHLLLYYASRLTSSISTLGGSSGAASITVCLILFFLACGFVEGYLATRLLLPSELVEADKISDDLTTPPNQLFEPTAS